MTGEPISTLKLSEKHIAVAYKSKLEIHDRNKALLQVILPIPCSADIVTIALRDSELIITTTEGEQAYTLNSRLQEYLLNQPSSLTPRW